jgi:hypothetical protein
MELQISVTLDEIIEWLPDNLKADFKLWLVKEHSTKQENKSKGGKK